MTQPIRHFKDEDRKFNGSEGDWTICGLPWTVQPAVGERCQACVDAVVNYADGMRAGNR